MEKSTKQILIGMAAGAFGVAMVGLGGTSEVAAAHETAGDETGEGSCGAGSCGREDDEFAEASCGAGSCGSDEGDENA